MIALFALAFGLMLSTAAHAEPPFQALAREVVGAGQGVLVVAEDGTVLAAEAAERAVHPASVTKIATTLAMLQRLGPEHRFATRLSATGRISDGTLRGNLLVEASGDPFLVDEGALLMLRRLHALGLRTVDGRLTVRGPLLFNWEPDPAGSALARTLSGKVADTVWATVGGGDTTLTLRAAALSFRGRGDEQRNEATPLLVYHSPPLLAVLKALNGYSNNIFHHASDTIGGPMVVATLARAAVPPALRDEIVIINAAGAGTENRISPRAAVALLQALARELGRSGHDLTAVLPVSGIDSGTLHDRLLVAPAGRGIVVGKTGTYGSEGASALAGALHTTRFGTVTFAVLNRDVPVPEARRRQDAFVTRLAAVTGAEPWRYTTGAAPAFDQAEIQ